MNCEEADELLIAFHDGELPPDAVRLVAAHIERCPACAKALESLEALRRDLRGQSPFSVPPGLQAKIAGDIAARSQGQRSIQRPRTALLAASHIAALACGGLIGVALWNDRLARDFELRELVSAQMRLLQENLSVAASETHTVRPWFAGKLDFSPAAPNLDAHGFQLLEGRIVHFEGRPAAGLIYGRRLHKIAVFVHEADGRPRAPTQLRGLSVTQWTAGNLRYDAVSDLSPEELSLFAGIFRQAAEKPVIRE